MSRLTSWVCPICGRKMGKPGTRYGSAKGMTVVHARARHPLIWAIIHPERRQVPGVIFLTGFKVKEARVNE